MNVVEHIADLTKKTIPVIALAGVAYLGERGGDGGFIKDVWMALKTASPPVAMVLFLLFLDERADRKRAQKETNERTLDFVKTTNTAAATFEKVLGKLQRRGRNGRVR